MSVLLSVWMQVVTVRPDRQEKYSEEKNSKTGVLQRRIPKQQPRPNIMGCDTISSEMLFVF
jgi:hypothetical protein